MEDSFCHSFSNLYIQADLIHLGAKYSPCMRNDANIYKGMTLDKAEEKTSGCCIRNDGSGCVQTVRGKCSVSVILNHTDINVLILNQII
jgi:hypothetical protein